MPMPTTTSATSLLETSQIANAPVRTDSAPSGADLRAAAERQRQLEKEGTHVHGLFLSGHARKMIVMDGCSCQTRPHESNSPAW